MSRSPSPDYEKALTLLKAALGDFSPKQPLKRVIAGVPDFGAFEWMLTILGLEIDLRVDIPEALADKRGLSADEFCKKLAKLPKVDSPGYTLECLGLVAQALLSLEVGSDASDERSANGAAQKKASRRASPSTTKKPNVRSARVGASKKRSARSKTAVGAVKNPRRGA